MIIIFDELMNLFKPKKKPEKVWRYKLFRCDKCGAGWSVIWDNDSGEDCITEGCNASPDPYKIVRGTLEEVEFARDLDNGVFKSYYKSLYAGKENEEK